MHSIMGQAQCLAIDRSVCNLHNKTSTSTLFNKLLHLDQSHLYKHIYNKLATQLNVYTVHLYKIKMAGDLHVLGCNN